MAPSARATATTSQYSKDSRMVEGKLQFSLPTRCSRQASTRSEQLLGQTREKAMLLQDSRRSKCFVLMGLNEAFCAILHLTYASSMECGESGGGVGVSAWFFTASEPGSGCSRRLM